MHGSHLLTAFTSVSLDKNGRVLNSCQAHKKLYV